MPFEVTLSVEEGSAWAALRRCPSIARALARTDTGGRVDVTELLLEANVMSDPYELPADDAEFLAHAGGAPVLLPDEIHDEDGQPQTDFVGTIRVAFLGWLAQVARDTGATIRIAYLHERGDWPYEMVTWTLGAKQQLHLMSFEGGSDVIWEGQLER